MLDHFGLFTPASSFTEVLAFYDAALAPLGYQRKDFVPGHLDETARPPVHFAFRAQSHKQVDEFHAEGLKAGGTDNGKPGIREIYHPNYYGAFVRDPCGNSVEVAIHSPRVNN